jgi:hypothetical protein
VKAWLGIGLTLASVLAAVFAPWIASHDPLSADFTAFLKPPGTPGHPLGTDQLGRDLLARVLHGARLALFIGGCTVVITALVGGVLGLLAGFVERWPSAVIMRLADVQLSFPFILLALTINAIVGLGLRNIIIATSCTPRPLSASATRACSSATCFPTRRRRSSWWPACNSRSSSSRKRPSASSASAYNPRRRRGAACCRRAAISSTSRGGSPRFRAPPSR